MICVKGQSLADLGRSLTMTPGIEPLDQLNQGTNDLLDNLTKQRLAEGKHPKELLEKAV